MGKGAFGAVYRGYGCSLQREVAIKIIHPSKATQISIARFKRDATLVAQLRSPYIVTLHSLDCESSEHFLYMTMELVKGQTLNQMLRKEGRFAPQRAISIALQILEALGEAHGHTETIVHRDLKPGNVMVTPRPLGGETVKVLDFGLAKMLDSKWSAQAITAPDSRAILGTLAYMAPEQFIGQVSPRSDIYAMGTLLYGMLVGKVPFRGDSILDYLNLHRFAPAPPFPKHLGIAPEIEQVVLRALEKCPEDRHQSAYAMHQALCLARHTATDTVDVSIDDVMTVTPTPQEILHEVRQTVLDMPRWTPPSELGVAESIPALMSTETSLAEPSVDGGLLEETHTSAVETFVSAALPSISGTDPLDAANFRTEEVFVLSEVERSALGAGWWSRILLGATMLMLITIGWRISVGWGDPLEEARPTISQTEARARGGQVRVGRDEHRMLVYRSNL